MSKKTKVKKSANFGWNADSGADLDEKFSTTFEATDLGEALSSDISELADVVAKHILAIMRDTYKVAGDVSKKNPQQHFSTFQTLLKDYKDWDNKTKKRFARKVKKDLHELDSLVHSAVVGVAQFRYLWQARTNNISRKDTDRIIRAISLSRVVPETEDFLHWCCCRSVRDVYRYPYLFDTRSKLTKRQRQDNDSTLTDLVSKAVKEETYSRSNASHLIQTAIQFVKGARDNDAESSDEDSHAEEVGPVSEESEPEPPKRKTRDVKKGGSKKEPVKKVANRKSAKKESVAKAPKPRRSRREPSPSPPRRRRRKKMVRRRRRSPSPSKYSSSDESDKSDESDESEASETSSSDSPETDYEEGDYSDSEYLGSELSGEDDVSDREDYDEPDDEEFWSNLRKDISGKKKRAVSPEPEVEVSREEADFWDTLRNDTNMYMAGDKSWDYGNNTHDDDDVENDDENVEPKSVKVEKINQVEKSEKAKKMKKGKKDGDIQEDWDDDIDGAIDKINSTEVDDGEELGSETD